MSNFDRNTSFGYGRGVARPTTAEIDQGLRRLLREGMADGTIGECDPKMTSFALAGALNWIAHWSRDSLGLKPAQVAQAFVGLFESGLLPRR